MAKLSNDDMLLEGCEALKENGFPQLPLHVEQHGEKFYVVLDDPSNTANAAEIEAVLPVFNASGQRVTA